MVILALLVSFAVAIHSLEASLPVPIPFPGAKLGLANIITLLTLIVLGFHSGLFVALLRSILGSLLTGNILGFGFLLSFCGAGISTLVMAALLPLQRKGLITILSVSICGAVAFNITQLTVAALLVRSFLLWRGYLPFLLLLALPTGFFTGLATLYLERLMLQVLP